MKRIYISSTRCTYDKTARILLRLSAPEKARWLESAAQLDVYGRRSSLSEFIRRAVNDRIAAMTAAPKKK
jgi:hypothetical protein